MKGFQYNDPIKLLSGVEAPQIEFLEKPVRFSLRHCSTQKDHCISTVSHDKTLLQAMYNRFGTLENMTWQQARQIDHTKGISIEPKSSQNHAFLSKEFTTFDTFGHFRVNAKSKPTFRVFGTLQGDCFCILLFDVNGKINH